MLQLKPQLILRTAFDVGKYRNQKNSPVSDNEARKSQYIIGSVTFQQAIPNYLEFDITIIDNTVESIDTIPLEFRELWKSARIICSGTNRFGRFNKGAGDVETLRFALKNQLINRNFLFYELRLKTIDSKFIRSFIDFPRNLITLETDECSAKSGYVGFEYSTALNFYKSAPLIKMTVTKTSIENLLFQYWNTQSLEFFPKGNYALRFDPWANRYIPY